MPDDASAEVVNLRMARKRRARSEREAVAEANRVAHSISVRERKRLRSIEDRRTATIEAHRREPDA